MTKESKAEGKCTICEKELNGLICNNEWCNEIHVECSTCKNVLNQSDAYDYRGFIFCLEHFEEGEKKVEDKRRQVIETTEHAIKSQVVGEWHNGGYKTMKIDAGGNPIAKIKEPQILKDYEKGKL